MEKAYDLKGLGEKFKEQGLELLEENAKVAVEVIFSWLEESAKLSENTYDDLAVMLYPKMKELILEQAEKINSND